MLLRGMIPTAVALALGSASFVSVAGAQAQGTTPPAAPEASGTGSAAGQVPPAAAEQAPAAAGQQQAPAPGQAPAAAAPAQPAAGGQAAAAREGVTNEDGKYYTADGDPTYNIAEDGTVDWYTFSGFRRYHAECHVCHGPEGLGSSYAPSLVNSLKTMEYSTFLEVVTNGRLHVDASNQNVMPAFGTNPNVMCYIDDLYIYLEARAKGGLKPGRPAKREDKPEAAIEAENACMGG
ncbi:c-type cytochrome, methanol metabolism-related [Faunimonas sp. B44]|uniref:c-type cytochrome, methanol metabolism-related n=1 Tax=Faunimonas sp. B44 TaxID=3461493 RepID=UPI004044D811